MKDAIELYYLNSYEKAKEKFLQKYSQDPLCASYYLYKISQALREEAAQSTRLNAYIAELYKQNQFDKYCEFHNEQLAKFIWCEYWNFVLEALYHTGRLNDFEVMAKRYWQHRIKNKKYKNLSSFYNLIKEKRPYLIENYLGQIRAVCLMGNNEEAIKAVNELLEVVARGKHRLKSKISEEEILDDVIASLKTISHPSADLEKNLYKLKIKRDIKKKNYWNTKEVLEYSILFKNEPEELIKLVDLDLKDFKEIIEKTFVKMRLIKKHEQRVSTNTDQDSEKDEFRFYELEKEELQEKGYSRTDSFNDYISDSEREFIVRIKKDDEEILDHAHEIIHTLVTINFYHAAYELLKKMKGPQYAYMRCWVMLQLENYNELIEESLFCLKEYQLQGDQAVPFNYFIARGHLGLNEEEKANKFFREVKKENPNFADVVERLSRAKS